MQKYVATIESPEPPAGTVCTCCNEAGVYLAREVDAALAAKDARIELLLTEYNTLEAEVQRLRADAARLDKLPDCFHMIHTDAYGYKWWLTRAPNKMHATVREALDAHQEPKP